MTDFKVLHAELTRLDGAANEAPFIVAHDKVTIGKRDTLDGRTMAEIAYCREVIGAPFIRINGKANAALLVCLRNNMTTLLSALELAQRLESLFVTSEGEAAITVNILRQWPREKIERFALHLLGDHWQELEAENASLKAEVANLKDVIAAPDKPRYAQLLGENASLEAQLVEQSKLEGCELHRTMLEVMNHQNLEWTEEYAKLEMQIAALQEQLAAKERELANYIACQIGQVPKP